MNKAKPHANSSNWKWISRSSGVYALLLGGIFLWPILSSGMEWLFHTSLNGWPVWLANNWLTVIIKIHAGVLASIPDPLVGLNILDFIILMLVSEVILGLGFPLLKVKKAWTIVALIQPLLGIVLFILTQHTGRSAVMGGILTLTILQLCCEDTRQVTAWFGILGGFLLFIGDISVGIYPSLSLAYLTGVGYLLLTIWFFLVGISLFRSPTALTFDKI